MAALGATVPPRKDAFQALAAQPLTQAEMACRTGLTNRTAFGLVQARLEVEVHPELSECHRHQSQHTPRGVR